MEAETLNYKPDWPQGSVMVDEGIERMLYKPLLYKPDWPEAGQRLEAFWRGEVLDRPVIKATAPRDVQVPEPKPKDDVARHTDPEFVIAAINARYQNTFYGGEAHPLFGFSLGYASYGNPEAIFDERTVWPIPYLRRSSLTEYRFDPNNRWWQTMLRLAEAQRRDGLGKYFIDVHPGDTPTDQLSHLRGPEGLAMDLIDCPDEVHRILAYLLGVRIWMLDQVVKYTQDDGGGPAMMWERTGHLQCDFSCMISPKMFREFVMPELVAQARWAGCGWYHLDGPNALQHLPDILEIPHLRFVQWCPGKAHREGLDWPDVLKAIRASGKGLELGVTFERVEEAIRTCGPRGLRLRMLAPSEEAARDVLKKAERWSCEHPWDLRHRTR